MPDARDIPRGKRRPRGGPNGRPRTDLGRGALRRSFRVSAADWARIEARAAEKGLTPAAWVRLVIANALLRAPTPREPTEAERVLSDALVTGAEPGFWAVGKAASAMRAASGISGRRGRNRYMPRPQIGQG